jgi:fimbrial chaperone protein
VLLAGENRAIRLQYVGEPAPASELPYRMVAEQLPVEIGDEQTGARVRIVVRYEGAVYIVPPGAKPDIVVEETAAVPLMGGATGLAVTVRNRGNKHVLLNEPKLSVRSGGRVMTLDGDDLQGLAGQNVLAGNSRRFILPWPAGLPVGGVDATLEFRATP